MNAVCGPSSWDGDASSVDMAGKGDDEQVGVIFFSFFTNPF